MRVLGVNGSAIAPPRRASRERAEPEAPAQGRALIALDAAAPAERLSTASRHPAAPFLAQLIATHMQAPQTRARRRAEPAEAIAAYAAMASRVVL